MSLGTIGYLKSIFAMALRVVAALRVLISVFPGAVTAESPCTGVQKILQDTEQARQLTAPETVDCLAADQTQFTKLLREQISRDLEPPRNAAEGRLFEFLGLLPPQFPYLACVQNLYDQQTAAFFQPDFNRFVVPSWVPLQRATVVHELTHALQHHTFNLNSFLPPATFTSDEFLTRMAIIEGDAVFTELLEGERRAIPPALTPPPATALRSFAMFAQSGATPITEKAITEKNCKLPEFFSDIFQFPYMQGARFIQQRYTQGGLAAVNQLYRTPPRTTSEILHPELFPRSRPIGSGRTTLLRSEPPSCTPSCSRVFFDRVGELGISALLSVSFSREDAARRAAIWQDDWIELWESKEERVIIWQIVTSSAEQAIALSAAWHTLLRKNHPAGITTEPSAGRWRVHDDQLRRSFQGSVAGVTFSLHGSERIT